MIKKYIVVTFTLVSLVITACGSKKETVKNAAGNIEQSTESVTLAKAKDMQLQVKDANGNTVTLTGDATINEAGEMVFEGKDSAGNVVKVTGTAEKTEDGGFKVKEAAVEGTSKVVADDGQETNNAGQNENVPAAPEVKPEIPATPEHTHTWNPVETTIHHDATGHYEDVVVGTRTVVDKEAWYEPIYEWKYMGKTRCIKCGQVFNTADECFDHQDVLADNGDYTHGSYEFIAEKVQTDTIHHEAETHEEDIKEKRWVEDTAAYDETVTTGYICSCGATK